MEDGRWWKGTPIARERVLQLYQALSEIAENSSDRGRARLHQGASLGLQRGAQGVGRIGDNYLGAEPSGEGGIALGAFFRLKALRVASKILEVATTGIRDPKDTAIRQLGVKPASKRGPSLAGI